MLIYGASPQLGEYECQEKQMEKEVPDQLCHLKSKIDQGSDAQNSPQKEVHVEQTTLSLEVIGEIQKLIGEYYTDVTKDFQEKLSKINGEMTRDQFIQIGS